MARPKLKGLSFLIVTILAVATFSLLTPSGQKTLDVWQDQVQTKINRIYYRLGRPLPGTPDVSKLNSRLATANLARGNPIFMRVFKLEGELELWMKGDEGFELFATYPICRWSGRLGPKLKEGDRQSPEGIYTVARRQLNPNSRWYKSFNLGYPNLYDRSYKRTGSFLMVHGGCSSIGCYAMTNPVMKEIWDLINAAYKGGQKRFAVHAFPFRMTRRNMRVYSDNKWHPFWQNIKPAYDLFNKTRVPPAVSVCEKKYLIKPGSAADSSHEAKVEKGCGEVNVSASTP